MKRKHPLKRRDRKTGVSPYVKYQKAPYRYSADYYEWRSRHVKKDKESSRRRTAA